MGIESVLLLFDRERPCWDAKCVGLAGESAEYLGVLRGEGLLEEERGIFWLSSPGKERFVREAQECYCAVVPGEKPADPARAAQRNRMALTLDNCFIARWGLKELRQGARLPFFPNLAAEDLYTREGGVFAWRYPRHEAAKSYFERWPLAQGSECEARDLAAFEVWREAQGIAWGEMEVDLLLLQHYDFEQYMRFGPQPNDRLGLLNTDRLYCFLADPDRENFVDAVCERIGKLHLFLHAQRRLFLPWFFDHDMEEQDAVNWVFFITETEAGAEKAREKLLPFGEKLLEGATPMDIWSLSIEALEGQKEKHETFWDLFAETAHAIARTP